MAGFAVLSLLMVLLGALSLWTRLGATLLIGIGLVLAWQNKKEVPVILRSISPHIKAMPKIPFLLLTIGSGLSFLASFAPITYYDSLVYHFALPSAYIQARHWVGQPELIYSAFPQMMEMLWTLGMLLVNDVLANLLGWIVAVLGLAAVYLFGRRYFGYKTGSWAAAMLGTMPAYILLSAGGYIDVGLAV
jgi:4-amino-4-deoxy-L-arabinose transferase-like glycosyltransferase